MIRPFLINRVFNFIGFGLLVILSADCNKQSAVSRSPTDTTRARTYQNPVFNYDFPDPNLVEGKDGYFYAYSTNSNWQRDGGGGPYTIPVLKSKNLADWEFAGDALPRRPDWKQEGGIWAPDAYYYRDTYFIYYSVSTWGDPNPGIGVATSPKPEGPFTDHGKLFLSKEIGVDNSIDPVMFVDEGKPYLVWGSFHGIYGVELSEDGLSVKGTKFQLAGDGYEGSFIYKKDGYYYYLGSTGTCCDGAASTYRVNVSRSRNFKGPYLDRDGRELLQNGGTLLLRKNEGATGFVGPGHNGDLITDKSGQTWMVYHAFGKQQANKRVMLLDKINWADGWPFIENSVPGIEKQSLPVFP